MRILFMITLLVAIGAAFVAYSALTDDVSYQGFRCGNAWDLDVAERVYAAQVPGDVAGACFDAGLEENANTGLVAGVVGGVAALVAVGSGVAVVRS